MLLFPLYQWQSKFRLQAPFKYLEAHPSTHRNIQVPTGQFQRLLVHPSDYGPCQCLRTHSNSYRPIPVTTYPPEYRPPHFTA